MAGVVFKSGVLPIGVLAKSGARILAELDAIARKFSHDIVITCADKEHAAGDPHTLGEAFDIRTHEWPDEHVTEVMLSLINQLGGTGDLPRPVSSVAIPNFATTHFYVQYENAGQPNAHLHVQRRNGTVYA